MTFLYKLEYCYDKDTPADSADYIHMRVEPPTYRKEIGKEAYSALPEGEKHPFIDGLFQIPGVVEVSSTAYRVWIMKSPVYSWEEVNTAVLNYIMDYLGEATMKEIPGSAAVDGLFTSPTAAGGFTLNSPVNRRER